MINQDRKRVLGRGLSSLIPAARGDAAAATAVAALAPGPGESIHEIAVDNIAENPFQPRTHIPPESLAELTESIRVSGVLQPVILRALPGGKYQLVAGQRRVLASKGAGRTTVPAVVRQMSEQEAMEITIVENLQREDLNPIQQARAFETLSRQFAMTQEQIAQRTGKDRASVANYLRLLRLSSTAQEALSTGRLTVGHAKVILGLPTGEEQDRVISKVLAEDLSVRTTEEVVVQMLNPPPPKEKDAANSERHVDPNVREAERELERALGCRVQIHDHNGRGKILIEYKSLEDFDRVVDALGK
ncbi:MAG TPA: ParB/RepB/Spo0J family partition protein [Terriglobales bacterium]|nr:ParB/RepB/Spo0J family partition protein [Terriglobales bacterium]